MSDEANLDGESAAPAKASRKATVRHRLVKTVKPRQAPVQAAAAEVRAQPRDGGPRLERQRRDGVDAYHIPLKLIPHGYTYEWKRKAVLGAPDMANMNQAMDNHWRPVPEGRHPGLLVEQNGLMLMERPTYLVQDALEEDRRVALSQLNAAENMLTETPMGQFQRGGSPGAREATKFGSEYAIAIPE